MEPSWLVGQVPNSLLAHDFQLEWRSLHEYVIRVPSPPISWGLNGMDDLCAQLLGDDLQRMSDLH